MSEKTPAAATISYTRGLNNGRQAIGQQEVKAKDSKRTINQGEHMTKLLLIALLIGTVGCAFNIGKTGLSVAVGPASIASGCTGTDNEDCKNRTTAENPSETIKELLDAAVSWFADEIPTFSVEFEE